MKKTGICCFCACVLAATAASGELLDFETVRTPEKPLPLPTGCAQFCVSSPRPRAGGVVKAADFGFSTKSNDNARAINAALEAARRTGAARVELAPGTYRCFGETVRLTGFTDFTFDGKGAELVFYRPADVLKGLSSLEGQYRANVTVEGCTRTLVQNLKMDWDWARHPLATMMRVTDVHVDEKTDNASYVDFELVDYSEKKPHPEYGKSLPIMQIKPMDEQRNFCPGGTVWIGNYEGHYGPKSTWLGPNRLRVWWMVRDEAQHYHPLYAPLFNPKANVRATRTIGKKGALYRVCHAYAGKNGFNLLDNVDLRMKDVTIWSCYGMALVFQGGQRWLLDNVRVEPRDALRPISSTADGLHVAASQGYAQFVGLVVRRNADDAINVHDCFTRGVKEGEKTVRIVHPRKADYIGLKAGDTVELAEADLAKTGFRAKVVAVSADNALLTFDRTVPREKLGWFCVFNRSLNTHDLLFRGCTFDSVEHRGCFSCPNVTIEDCTFRRGVGDPIRLFGCSYTLETFCEGAGSGNFVIRNCRFEGNNRLERGFASQKDNGSDIASVVRFPANCGLALPDPSIVSGILVEDCTFEDSWGCAVDLRIGENVTIRNNTFRRTPQREKVGPESGMLRFENVRGLSLSGNRKAYSYF